MTLAVSVDVAVVGAGAAGIAAGRALSRAGVSFAVLEARARIGGRAFTRDTPHRLDLGCGWLHSANVNPLVPLAREAGFTVDETIPPWQRPMPDETMSVDAQRTFRAAQDGFYDRMERAAQSDADRAAGDLLEAGNRWNPLIDAVSTYTNGVELDRLSVKDFDHYHDTTINFRVTEGYGALIARLGAALNVTTGCAVTAIDHGGREVVVTTTQGVLRARSVVLTVPTNLLAREAIRFTPALPDHLHAAAHLPLGLADKVFLQVENAEDLPHNSRLFGALDRRATGNYHFRPFGLPVIEGYFGGQCARDLEAAGPEAFFAFACDELVSMLGAQWRNRLSFIAASAWDNEAWSRGSYSHALPGHWDKRAVLAKPASDRVFFAGEATSPHFFSTAHGAWQSGEHAVRAALDALGSSQDGRED